MNSRLRRIIDRLRGFFRRRPAAPADEHAWLRAITGWMTVSEPVSIDLLPFLQERLNGFGIDTTAAEEPYPTLPANVTFDEAGCTITAAFDAEPHVRTFLDAAMGPELFNGTGTLIYRNDDFCTTVMVHRQAELQIFIVHWKSPEILSTIETCVDIGVRKAIEEEIERRLQS